jgi:CxxC-x17-CxxC domain-containing protein
MSFADRNLTCRECGSAFTFTSGEQEFHAEKGFENDPTRCPECRQARKRARNDGNGSYSGSNYGGGSGGGYSSSRGAREMHTTTCSQCGKEAQVPFVPSGDKPVYCSDCFQSHRPERTSSRW